MDFSVYFGQIKSGLAKTQTKMWMTKMEQLFKLQIEKLNRLINSKKPQNIFSNIIELFKEIGQVGQQEKKQIIEDIQHQ